MIKFHISIIDSMKKCYRIKHRSIKYNKRILLTFKGKFKFWNKSNKILKKIKHEGTLENINLLNSFINYRNNYFFIVKGYCNF